MKRILLALTLMLGLLAVPAVGWATPGAIVIDGYAYGTSAMLSVYNPTPHSPTMFAASENRYVLHADHYVYRFQQASSAAGLMIAVQRTSGSQTPLTPTLLSPGRSASVYLDGDYYYYVWDLSGQPPAATLNIAAAAPGTVSVQSPSYAGYFLKGSTQTISAYIEGTPVSVTASVSDNGGTTILGQLTGSGNVYSMSYTFQQSFQPIGGTAMPTLKVQANFASGPPVVASIPIYVTTHNAAYYQSVDSTWNYSTPYNNSFIGVANPTQMCYEFVVDQLSTAEPLQINSDIIAFMKKETSPYRDYTSRPGTKYTAAYTTPIPYADAIYFSGFHFAKVTKWDANGNPAELLSKWGPDEAVKSTSVNAFTGGAYGSPVLYFKK